MNSQIVKVESTCNWNPAGKLYFKFYTDTSIFNDHYRSVENSHNSDLVLIGKKYVYINPDMAIMERNTYRILLEEFKERRKI